MFVLVVCTFDLKHKNLEESGVAQIWITVTFICAHMTILFLWA